MEVNIRISCEKQFYSKFTHPLTRLIIPKMTSCNVTCRLCLRNVTNGKFELIKDTAKDILDKFSIILNLDENSELKMCSTCSMNLLAALKFKLTCTCTESAIITYFDGKNPSTLDLRDIYLKERKNKETVMISADDNICRLCMELTGDDFMPLHEMDKGLLQKFLPDINMDIIKEPVVCKSCWDSFYIHSNFLKNCSDVQKTRESSSFLQKDSQRDKFSHKCIVKMERVEYMSEDEMSNDSSIKLENPEREEIEQVFIKTEEVFLEPDEGKSYDVSLQDPLRMDIREGCDYKPKSKGVFKRRQLKRRSPSQKQPRRFTRDFETVVKSCLKKRQVEHEEPCQVQMFKCDTCDYKTKFKSNLKRHQLKHKDPSQVQMYKCDTCDYETRLKSNFIIHQLRHKDPSQVQMYKCDTCDFETKIKPCLARHILRHKDPSQVEMHKCDTCDYETKDKSCLKRHQLKHKLPSQVQMYKCDTCDYKAKYKSNIKRHIVADQPEKTCLRHRNLSRAQL